MEEKIKNIISLYTKIPANAIGQLTIIDRSAVVSSILLHRMYANLAAEGVVVENYFSIKNYGELLGALNGKSETNLLQHAEPINISVSGLPASGNSIGIDVEEISMMPVVTDFREDEFYKMNFSPAEIAYCILHSNPYASFAGLFAAKEAIVKADNQYKNKPFHTITVDHLPGGKPVHTAFEISISHTALLAIAVAVHLHTPNPSSPLFPTGNLSQASPKNNSLFFFISITSLLLAALALFLILFKTV